MLTLKSLVIKTSHWSGDTGQRLMTHNSVDYKIMFALVNYDCSDDYGVFICNTPEV